MNEWLFGALLIIPLAVAATLIVRMNRPLAGTACRKCGAEMSDTVEVPGVVPFRFEPLRTFLMLVRGSGPGASDCPNCGAR